MVKRLGLCEESKDCKREVKALCSDCGMGLCIDHAAGHEKHTCPELEKNKVHAGIDDILEVTPLKEVKINVDNLQKHISEAEAKKK